MLILTGVAVNAVFVAQSNRSLDALLDSRVQLARQLARAGVGPQQIVNRTETDGVRAYLVLRNGTEFGTPAADRAADQEHHGGAERADPGGRGEADPDHRHRPGQRGPAAAAPDPARGQPGRAGGQRRCWWPGRSGWRCGRWTRWPRWPRPITEGNRGRRLSPTRTDTEIGQTARAFDEMLDELEGAETRARQAEERTRAFLADAAHELRTPITGVQAAAETLLHHGDALPAADREHLQALLVREAQRAGTLISDLLAAARLDAGVELRPGAGVAGRTWRLSELDRVRLLHPEATVTHRSGPDVVVDRRRRQGARHPAQRDRERHPGRRTAGPDPPEPLRRATASRCSTSGTPVPGCRRASGSGSSSGWSASTTAGRRRRRFGPRPGHRPRLRPRPRRRPGLPGPRRPRRAVPPDPPPVVADLSDSQLAIAR